MHCDHSTKMNISVKLEVELYFLRRRQMPYYNVKPKFHSCLCIGHVNYLIFSVTLSCEERKANKEISIRHPAIIAKFYCTAILVVLAIKLTTLACYIYFIKFAYFKAYIKVKTDLTPLLWIPTALSGCYVYLSYSV